MKILVLGLALLACRVAAADELLHFSDQGFSIKPLLRGKVGTQAVQVLALALPAGADGFASNVNVQIQPYAGTIDAYAKLSVDQFAQLSFALVAQKKIAADTIELEYTGAIQGTQMHFIARAIRAKKAPFVYLVTGTTTATQWPSVSPTLRDDVSSFKLD